MRAVLPSILLSCTALQWAGYNWVVRDSQNQMSGPGPNLWAGGLNNVYVNDGSLVMTVQQSGATGPWYSTEIYLDSPDLGYGTYNWSFDVPVDALSNADPNLVLGLFIYYNDTAEIDIEFSRWSDDSNTSTTFNADYCVQPSTDASCPSWRVPSGIPASTHSFSWTPSAVYFTSLDKNGHVINNWTFTGTQEVPIPKPPGLMIHMNFWMFQGSAPKSPDGSVLSVPIKGFTYEPLTLAPTHAPTTPTQAPSQKGAVSHLSWGLWIPFLVLLRFFA